MAMEKPPGTIKVTISVPTPLFDRLDEVRRHRNQTRSALFAELAAGLVHELEEAALDARFAAGYQMHPEGPDDAAWIAHAGAVTLGAVAAEDAHDWSEDIALDSGLDAAG